MYAPSSLCFNVVAIVKAGNTAQEVNKLQMNTSRAKLPSF